MASKKQKARGSKKAGKKSKVTKLRRYHAAPGSGVTDEQANDIGGVIDELRSRGVRITKKVLLEEARDPRSVAHQHFDWNDKTAAEKHRLDQAGRYLRAITIVVRDVSRTPIRAFHPVFIDKGQKSYEPIQAIRTDVDMMTQLLRRAKSDLRSWQARYDMLRHVAELSGIWEEVDKAVGDGDD